MPGTPKEGRDNADRCSRLAADTDNPILRDNFANMAERWNRTAIELEHSCDLLEQWSPAMT